MTKSIKDIKHIFGKNLRDARKLRRISQEKFAEMIEIGPPALSKIECGKSYPNPETMEKIVNVLNIKPHLLFVDTEAINIEKAKKDMIKRIEILVKNETLFKSAYDFIVDLTNNI